MLDAAGLRQVKIFVSSSLDEYSIERLLTNGAPIDGFGVGAHMATSSDAPVLDTAYKLAEYAGRPKLKLSESKMTLPGRKQIFRNPAGDIIGLQDEHLTGEPLLIRVMTEGKRLHPPESPQACRDRCRAALATLPQSLLSLAPAEVPYRVDISSELLRLKDRIQHV